MITVNDQVNQLALLVLLAFLLGPLLVVVFLSVESTAPTIGATAHTQAVSSSAQQPKSVSVDGIKSTNTAQNAEVQSVSDNIGFEIFNEELESFLSQPVASIDSDWGRVTKKDLDALRHIFHSIIQAKWEEDVDGNVPVEFKIYVLQD